MAQYRVQKAYEGQWEAYAKEYSLMTTADKMKYYEEISAGGEAFQKARKSTWSNVVWLLLFAPVLLTFLFFTFGVNPFLFALGCFLALFFLFALCLAATKASRPMEKPPLFLCAIFLAGLSILLAFQPIYSLQVQYRGFGAFFLLAIVAYSVYVGLSGLGFSELVTCVAKEKENVALSLRDAIYLEPLEKVKPQSNVQLEAEEVVYCEEPAVLLDVLQKYPDSQGVPRSSFFDKFNTLFTLGVNRHIPAQNKMRQAWEILFEPEKKTSSAPYAKTTRAYRELGSLLVTDRRVLFLTKSTGFQIRLGDLSGYSFQDDVKVNTVTLESATGVRILRSDSSRWIVMFIDRLVRDRRAS